MWAWSSWAQCVLEVVPISAGDTYEIDKSIVCLLVFMQCWQHFNLRAHPSSSGVPISLIPCWNQESKRTLEISKGQLWWSDRGIKLWRRHQNKQSAKHWRDEIAGRWSREPIITEPKYIPPFRRHRCDGTLSPSQPFYGATETVEAQISLVYASAVSMFYNYALLLSLF